MSDDDWPMYLNENMTTQISKVRESNLELLRIVAMFLMYYTI